MIDIIFATKNRNKIIEIQDILGNTFNVISMEDFGVHIDVVEDGITFEENAIKKAMEIMKVTNKVTLADDSGLEIDYLNKEPGVYSSRYLGEDTSYDFKNNNILKLLDGVEEINRTARFVSCVACAIPSGEVFTKMGTIEGIIHSEICGTNGFGYDPIFFVKEYNKTTSEMTLKEKNSISHRGKALFKMRDELLKRLG